MDCEIFDKSLHSRRVEWETPTHTERERIAIKKDEMPNGIPIVNSILAERALKFTVAFTVVLFERGKP